MPIETLNPGDVIRLPPSAEYNEERIILLIQVGAPDYLASVFLKDEGAGSTAWLTNGSKFHLTECINRLNETNATVLCNIKAEDVANAVLEQYGKS